MRSPSSGCRTVASRASCSRVAWRIMSAPTRASRTCRCSTSSSAWSNDSSSMRSISSSVRPYEGFTSTERSRPVRRSDAVTLRIPFASTRKVTSSRGTPAGKGSMGILKRARLRLSVASSRSPCSTWTSTAVWLSTAVVKVSFTLTGIVVLRSTSRVNTPPIVSMPSESGTTSSSSMSRRLPDVRPGPEVRGEPRQEERREPLVHVVAPEPRVAVGREHLEHAAPELQDGDVEGAAAEIVDGDHPLGTLVETVGKRGGRRLVHEPQHLQAGQPPGVLRRLPLAVIEVGGHGDHRLGHRLAERRLRPSLELPQDVRRHFGRRDLASVYGETDRSFSALDEAIAATVLRRHMLDAEPHEPLDREDRIERPLDDELASALTHHHFARRQEGDGRGQEPRTRLGVGDDQRTVIPEEGHQAVRGSQVDADDPTHCAPFSSVSSMSPSSVRRYAISARRCRRSSSTGPSFASYSPTSSARSRPSRAATSSRRSPTSRRSESASSLRAALNASSSSWISKTCAASAGGTPWWRSPRETPCSASQ